MKVIIIGAGLFGSVAAALARKTGHQVTVIDSRKKLAASPCSGNLTKPSWLESIGPQKAEEAYAVLRSLYTLRQAECLLRPLLNKTIKLDYVAPQDMLLPPDLTELVIEVGPGQVRLASGKLLKGAVLVAAGVWCSALVKTPPIRRIMGSSLRIRGQIKQPGIYMYAPYKHAVAYNISEEEIWCGDSASILEANWNTVERTGKLKYRAKEFFKLNAAHAEVRVGARPYVEGFKHGYFKKVYPNTWVSTGGAKNGMVMAAYQAKQFLEAL